VALYDDDDNVEEDTCSNEPLTEEEEEEEKQVHEAQQPPQQQQPEPAEINVNVEAVSLSFTDPSTPPRSKSVRFDTIEFREYEMGIASAGIPSSGVPLGILWTRGDTVTVSVDEYENLRPAPPRRGQQLILPNAQRTDL
jgi:hypothetical protein